MNINRMNSTQQNLSLRNNSKQQQVGFSGIGSRALHATLEVGTLGALGAGVATGGMALPTALFFKLLKDGCEFGLLKDRTPKSMRNISPLNLYKVIIEKLFAAK